MAQQTCLGVRHTPRARATADAADPVYLRTIVSLITLLILAFVSAGRLSADPNRTVGLKDVDSGTLLIRTDQPGRFKRAPTVRTDIRMTVSGLVARVTVSQAFRNPSKQWIQGVYVFPLPANAAVDRLRLRVGDRFIEGKVKERAEARRIYLEALRKGHKAALTEQERPNMFTNSVANIGPGETVIVQIEYQHALRYDRGAFSLRFPMVVGPRYIPSGAKVVAFNGTGWGANTRTVPDARRITPPVLNPKHGKINPVSLTMTLKAGFPIAWIKSATHKIKVTDNADGTKTIVFDKKAVFAEKDLVIRWLPKTGSAPGAGLFTETIGGKTYALLMVMPPHNKVKGIKRLPREVIFVIDTSGSMSGTSIAQARAALLLALARLAPGDRFNVIEFNSHARALFPSAHKADRNAVARAKAFVSSLQARGGTEMAKALNLALTGQRDSTRLRQVIFLTDGSVGNEAQLFGLIKRHLGDTRLFTVGIGSAPNSYFMTKAAQYGRGTFTYISRVADVKARMSALFQKIEEPVLTDIHVALPAGIGAEVWPKKIADLYRGEPVIVAIRVDQLKGKIRIAGRFAGKPWKLALPLNGGQAGKGMATLWARAKIAALMDSLHEGADRKEVKAQVLTVALAHHLVSKYTSLVAIDVTPARPKGVKIVSRNVPLNLPAGWDFEKVFGKQQGQRKEADKSRRAGAPVQPRVIASETERRSVRTGAKRKVRAYHRSSVNKLAVRRPAARGLADMGRIRKPRITGGAAAPKPTKTVVPKASPPPVRRAAEEKARVRQATPSGKDDGTSGRKPVQQADASADKTAGAKAPAQAAQAASRERRDLAVSFAILVLLMAGLMVWLRRSPLT